MSIRLIAFSLLFSALVVFPPTSWGQTTPEKAQEYYLQGLFKEAAEQYEVLLKKERRPSFMARLAQCYRMVGQIDRAAYWYAQVVKQEGMQAYWLEYGQSLMMQEKYQEAQRCFAIYAAEGDSKVGLHYAKACDFAMQNKELPASFKAEHLPAVNSESADFAPHIYKNEVLFASSRRIKVEIAGESTVTNDAFNQLYRIKKGAQGQSMGAEPLHKSLSGFDYNDAPIAISPDADLVAISSNNFMDGIRHVGGSGMLMDIYFYRTKDWANWDYSTEQFFDYNASVDKGKTPFSTGHPCFSPSGKTLYFCSNRPGGQGGYDIYSVSRTKDGWSKPRNLGYPINTPGDEMSPFIDQRGRLYFASNWHEGFGGMDIFTAERYDFGWGNITNLGWGVNSAADDMYFTIDSRTGMGYFSSNRKGGKGNEDIYKALARTKLPNRRTLRTKVGERLSLGRIHFEPNSARISNASDSVLYKLLVALHDNPEVILQIAAHTDAKGSANENLELSKQRAKSVVEYLKGHSVDSRRLIAIGYGESRPLNDCVDGKPCSDAKHAENRRTEVWVIGRLENGRPKITYTPPAPPTPEEKAEEERKKALAAKVKTRSPRTTSRSAPKAERKDHYAVGDYIEVANIYYETNQARINESRSPGLKELLDILKNNPRVVVEIRSHTDSKGRASYNLNLSQRRAKAVRDYLVRKGIPSKRIRYRGFGETQILNGCVDGVSCSDTEHAKNRRTEFKVVARTGFKVGEIINVKEITYRINRATIEEEKSPGLEELLVILKDNPGLRIEIGSHTDSKGRASYNLELSQKRAKAIYSYLISKGISSRRLRYKGYGESQLLNGCKDGVRCSETKHRENRRTEFKVMGI